MVRKKGTFYWTFRNFASRNFKTLRKVKVNLLKAAKKNSNIFGRNEVMFVESMIKDVKIGFYGASKRWRKSN